MEIESKYYNFQSRKLIWKCRPENGDHLVSLLMCYLFKYRSTYMRPEWGHYCVCRSVGITYIYEIGFSQVILEQYSPKSKGNHTYFYVMITCVENFRFIWKSAADLYVITVLIGRRSRYIDTHWGRVTHTIISSDNGLLPGRRQAIILTNAGIF